MSTQRNRRPVVTRAAVRAARSIESLERRAMLAAGQLDPTFGVQLTVDFDGQQDQVFETALQPDGKILAAGRSIVGAYDGDLALARFNPDGSPDASFGQGGKVVVRDPTSADQISLLHVQPDGRILAVGTALSTDLSLPTDQNALLARFNPDGSVDTSFGVNGRIIFDAGSISDLPFALTIQPDGKILIGGSGNLNGSAEDDFTIGRFFPDGTLDESFGDFGSISIDMFAFDIVNEMIVLPDNRILVVGTANQLDTQSANRNLIGVTMLTADGLLDTSFATNGRVLHGLFTNAPGGAHATGAFRQPDGKIVIGGWLDDTDPTSGDRTFGDFMVMRLNPDGELDFTFNNGQGFNTTNMIPGETSIDVSNAFEVLPSGKFIVAGGTAVLHPDLSRTVEFALARYNADGTLDTSYGVNGRAIANGGPVFSENVINDIVLQPDGKVVGAGRREITTTAGTVQIDFAVARFNADGSLDASFGAGAGSAPANFIVEEVASQPDRSLVAAGYEIVAGHSQISVARYTATGRADTSFGSSGKVRTELGTEAAAYAVARQADGKYLVAGHVDDNLTVLRYTAAGALDPSFNSTGFVSTDIVGSGQLFGVTTDAAGRVVAAGTADGNVALFRLTSSGAFDSTFDADGKALIDLGTAADAGTHVVVQPDGKLLVGVTYLDGPVTRMGVIRLNANGSLDTSFAQGGKLLLGWESASTRDADSFALQPDGRIVIAGRLNNNLLVARFSAQGTVDGAFGIATASVNGVFDPDTVTIQPGGRILVTGTVQAANLLQTAVIAFTPAGQLDTAFGTNGVVVFDLAGSTTVRALRIGDLAARASASPQPDGNLIVGSGQSVADATNPESNGSVRRLIISDTAPPPVVNGPLTASTLVFGTERGASANVVAHQRNRTDPLQSYFAFDPGFLGGIRVATGDINGDGTPDVIVAAGPGAGPHVKVFNGINADPIAGPLGSFFAFDPGFDNGMFVASGDIDGDGRDDVIVAADAGAGPHVKVFSGATGAEIRSFFAFDPGFRGGIRVASGDVSGDGRADLIVGAGPGAGAHVKVFTSIGSAMVEIRSFFAFDNFDSGIYVAGGDLTHDGRADILVGAGAGAGAHVKAFSGANLAPVVSFFADDNFAGGVRVAVADFDANGSNDIVTATGFGAAHVKAFDVTDFFNPPAVASFLAYPGYSGGIYVG